MTNAMAYQTIRCSLAAAVVACGLAANAGWTYNATGKTLSDDNWTLTATASGGELTVTKCTAVTDATVLDLSGPVVDSADAAKSYAIVAFADKVFQSRNTIQKLCLPDTLRSIGMLCFADATALVHVEPFLPASVTEIKKSAFSNCPITNDLSLVNSGLTEIPDLATKTYGAFCGIKSKVVDCSRSGITYIGTYAFYNASNLSRFYLPPTVEGFGMFAFYKDSALEHVEPFLPASVNSIGASAFNGCPVTNDLVLSCVGLKTLPAPGTRGAYLFGSIKSRVVDCSQSGLVTIGERAFSDATDITRLYLPRTLESIGPCAFYNVKTLQHVEPCLPAAITNIGGSAFAYCPITNDLVLSNVGLKSLPGPGTGTVGLFPSAQFPTIDCSRSGIASIGGSAFNGVSTLTNVFLSPDLMTIDGSVFQSCTSLREVSFLSCPTTVNSTAFRYAMGLPGRMTFPKRDEAWTAFIESAKTARTFKTWDEAKETERNAYLAEFPVRPKPLGYMVYGGVNRWFVPVNRSSFVLFLR